MGFLFAHVCDLLQRLEDNLTARAGVRTFADILGEWFATHRGQFLAHDHDAAALLSTLLPEKRTDRVYLMKEKRLQAVIGRGLLLGRSRIPQLARWADDPASGLTLPECVELVLRQTPNPTRSVDMQVTVEEIDGLLHRLASACRFSAPSVRRRSGADSTVADRELSLGDLYKRVTPTEAKWLTRLILKNFEPVVLDPQMVYRNYHPALPSILKVQDDFTVAGRILADLRRNRSVVGRADLCEYLKPTLGVKVGRQPWIKGRSIKHCLDMGHGRMSWEAKMDGEYCQIHIDLSKDRDCIQIFSKSGKDSTRDRIALHGPIRESLQLNKSSCPLKKGCILEGELVVWSDKEHKILDFHKIRKHVSRSGTFLGTEQDSQRHPWEHLMIIYYDVLMIDDESLLAVRQSERMARLKQLITEIPGQSALVKRIIIDCDRPSAASDLRRAFAKCIAAREEGLVLKPDDPYFDFNTCRRPYSCCAIKLKKEYMGNFGDIGDFAVVGARLDAAKARTFGMRNIKWTHFYVACLENKDEVRRFRRKPRFVVTNVVELNATQHDMFSTFVNPAYVAEHENDAISLRIEPGIDEGKRPLVIFTDPPVFDVRCFSFDKAGNTGFWSPRFPMVNKIHCDRTWLDTLSFSELQDIARKEKELPPPEDSQEMLGWIAALQHADPGRLEAELSSQASTASRTSTLLTPASPSVSSTSQRRLEISTPQPARVSDLVEVPSSPLDVPSPARALRDEPAELTIPSTIPEKQAGTQTGPGTIRTHRKRPSESQGTRSGNPQDGPKSRRCSADQTAATGPIIPSSRHSFSSNSSSTQREPLTDIQPRSSRRNSLLRGRAALPPNLVRSSTIYQPGSGEKTADSPATVQSSSLPLSASFNGAPASSSTSHPDITPKPRTENPVSLTPCQNEKTVSSHTESCKGTCRYLPQGCTLAGYTILLSPCIANYPWVTEDLLSCHGLELTTDIQQCDPITDSFIPSSLPSSSSFYNTKTTACVGRASASKKNKKPIILVDRRRKEATKAFLKQVSEAKQQHRHQMIQLGNDGKTQLQLQKWVDVYDWRVLEDLRREEKRISKSSSSSSSSSTVAAIWRKYWIGLT
ncbi:hypothetical protein V8F06_007199 [Rhypophila decipiens]